MQNNNGDFGGDGYGPQGQGGRTPQGQPGGFGQPTGPRIILESSYNIRRMAREALTGYWKQAVLATFIAAVILSAPVSILDHLFGITIPLDAYLDTTELGGTYQEWTLEVKSSPASGLYMLLVGGAVTFGLTSFFMALFRRKDQELGDVFSGFEYFGKTTGLFLWMCLFLFLWLIIPLAGIVLVFIAMLRYSMAFMVQVDDPSLPVPECLNRSKYMMQGNKSKFFCLMLSFIGWFLLASLPGAFLTALVTMTTDSFLAAFLADLVGMFFVACASAYANTAQIVFYDMLIGRIYGESYQPGVY